MTSFLVTHVQYLAQTSMDPSDGIQYEDLKHPPNNNKVWKSPVIEIYSCAYNQVTCNMHTILINNNIPLYNIIDFQKAHGVDSKTKN